MASVIKIGVPVCTEAGCRATAAFAVQDRGSQLGPYCFDHATAKAGSLNHYDSTIRIALRKQTSEGSKP